MVFHRVTNFSSGLNPFLSSYFCYLLYELFVLAVRMWNVEILERPAENRLKFLTLNAREDYHITSPHSYNTLFQQSNNES